MIEKNDGQNWNDKTNYKNTTDKAETTKTMTKMTHK